MTDVTAASGITFEHFTGGSGEAYIIEGMASGIATFDYDGDGYIDIYFLNGGRLRGVPDDKTYRNALYRNNGDFTFTDVTEEAGVGDTGHGLGVAVADYDGDGYEDIYINNFGPNVLYRNNGDKTFTDVTEAAGVGNGNMVGAGVSFFDIDGDGDLDLYCANYVDFTYDKHVPIVIDGRKFQAGPQYYQPVKDTLYRNEGNGTFTDVSVESGIHAATGPGMATVATDFDGDRDLDVYVAQDGKPNLLWINDGTGKFEEMALLFGVACDFKGRENSSMGLDRADYDNDGLIDLFVTDYQSEMPVLYRNLGGDFFEDATAAARLPTPLYAHVHWGTSFSDFDCDGFKDLFIACGHFDRIELLDDRTSMKVRNYLLLNSGDGKFQDVSETAGSGLQPIESSRAMAAEDFDNDGDLDVIVLNADARPTLMRNDTQHDHRWVGIALQQPNSLNPLAIGARVTVVTDQMTQISEVYAGRGYQSHFGTRLHFGLGNASEAKVLVTWPDGTETEHTGEIDQYMTITRAE